MNYSLILRPDLQEILDKYTEMREKLAALNALNEEQQRVLTLEREQAKALKEKMKRIIWWLFKREDEFKASLDSANSRNSELRRELTDMKLERDRADFLNEVKVLKLQEEVNYLHKQVAQFDDKLKQQLLLQDDRHKSEISEYKRLLEDANARISVLERNAAKENKLHNIESHPALTNKKDTKGKRNLANKLTIEVEKVHKKRKLYQEDKEDVFDI